jgi:hypothetical protein
MFMAMLHTQDPLCKDFNEKEDQNSHNDLEVDVHRRRVMVMMVSFFSVIVMAVVMRMGWGCQVRESVEKHVSEKPAHSKRDEDREQEVAKSLRGKEDLREPEDQKDRDDLDSQSSVNRLLFFR